MSVSFFEFNTRLDVVSATGEILTYYYILSYYYNNIITTFVGNKV